MEEERKSRNELLDVIREKGLNFYVVASLVFTLYTAGSIALILIMKKFPLLPQILLGESFTRR